MTNPTSAPKYATREEWLMAAYQILRPRFDELAELINTAAAETGKTIPGIALYTMPEQIHISVGFGFGAKRENGVIVGQSWRVFAAFGAVLGLEGKPTEMLPGPAFEMELMLMAETALGAYPHSALDVERKAALVPTDGVPVPAGGGWIERGYVGPAPQRARMIKCWCVKCGYTTRTARSWIVVARPVCPNPACEAHLSDMVTAIDADPING
jgi:hypothetical protein